MTQTGGQSETVLVGAIENQAHLFGILDRIVPIAPTSCGRFAALVCEDRSTIEAQDV